SSMPSSGVPCSGAVSRIERHKAAASTSPQLGCSAALAMWSMQRATTASAIAFISSREYSRFIISFCGATSAACHPSPLAGRTVSSQQSAQSTKKVEEAIVRADERQEPRAAVVKRNRREAIVDERMLDQFAGDAPRHDLPERGRHRDAVSAVAA